MEGGGGLEITLRNCCFKTKRTISQILLPRSANYRSFHRSATLSNISVSGMECNQLRFLPLAFPYSLLLNLSEDEKLTILVTVYMGIYFLNFLSLNNAIDK